MTTQREPLDLTQFAGHTPGPWRIFTPKDYADPDDPDYIGKCILSIEDAEGGTVVSTDSGRVNQHAGNMRLIAAAPDLLAEVTRLRAVNAQLREALNTAYIAATMRYTGDIEAESARVVGVIDAALALAP